MMILNTVFGPLALINTDYEIAILWSHVESLFTQLCLMMLLVRAKRYALVDQSQ